MEFNVKKVTKDFLDETKLHKSICSSGSLKVCIFETLLNQLTNETKDFVSYRKVVLKLINGLSQCEIYPPKEKDSQSSVDVYTFKNIIEEGDNLSIVLIVGDKVNL